MNPSLSATCPRNPYQQQQNHITMLHISTAPRRKEFCVYLLCLPSQKSETRAHRLPRLPAILVIKIQDSVCHKNLKLNGFDDISFQHSPSIIMVIRIQREHFLFPARHEHEWKYPYGGRVSRRQD